MTKYTLGWKQKKKKWVQKHEKIDGESIWKIHYIQNDIEYSNGEYSTEESALEDLKKYNV
ncbi:MAG: hypothetical protein ACLPSL_09230 [Smithella sp.]